MSKTPLPLVVEPAVAADAPVLGAMQADAFHSAFFHDIFIAPYTTGAWAGFIQRATAAAVQSPPPPPHASPRTIIGVIREGGMTFPPPFCKKENRVASAADGRETKSAGLAKAACVVHVAPDKHAVMELYGPYRESWGEPLPSMNADKMDAFFSGMTTQHQSTMGDTPHIRPFYLPPSDRFSFFFFFPARPGLTTSTLPRILRRL